MTERRPKGRPVVEVVKSSYQPSQAELAEDLRVNATFKQSVKVLLKFVQFKYVKKPEYNYHTFHVIPGFLIHINRR